MPEIDASQWDAFLAQFPDAHLLQTTAWGELKSAYGWEAVRILAGAGSGSSPSSPQPATFSAGAQVLFRRLPVGLTFAYIPKGPVAHRKLDRSGAPIWEAFWKEVDTACRKRRCLFLKLEPDLWEDCEEGQVERPPHGFRSSPHAIQPPRTLVVNLDGSEDQILSRMKQKTRYNIRLGIKKGVIVHPSADLDVFYQLMQMTGSRDQFGVHSQDYYRRTYELFHPRGACELFLAELDGLPLAALMAFAHGSRAWYFYGASSDAHREYMPAYLLQWEAMRWARAQGCAEYDLWGVPDAGEASLEANFTRRSDGLWGVYRFKRGFGGELRRSAGPWDRVYQPVLYRLYLLWLNGKKVQS